MLIQYSPNPHSYAAIRINHVATVEHFPFPDIIESARKIQPKTYLVFLNTVRELFIHVTRKECSGCSRRGQALSIPFPQDPWFPFIVNPIAPFPPPMEGHVTSEMCIPIYPNTSHPSGRAAVHTEPPFPYDNCYHWSSARDVGVRVRPRQTGHFDDDIAVKTRIRDERELWRMVARDCTKVEEATRRDVPDGFPSGPPETQPEATARPSTPDTALGPEDGHGSMIGGAPEACSGSEGHGLAGHEGITETEDATDADAQSCASDDAISDFQALVGMGIFGTRLDNKDDYPLVDVWLELADQLKQEDIPDPRDFYVECNTLVQ